MKIRLLSACVFSSLLAVACSESAPQKPQEKNTASAAVASDATNTESAVAVTKNPDWPTYLATTDATNAPYELRDDKGIVIGFDADLIQAIAREEKFNVDIVPQVWDGIFNSLNSGEKHILIAPLTITPERREQVLFTLPYIYPTRTAYLLEETANNLGIKTYADLVKGTVSTKGKTTNQTSLEADFGNSIKITPTDSQYLAFTSMVSKKTDIGFGDTAVMQYHADSVKDIKLVKIEQPLKMPIEAGFAVKKGNQELVEKLNSGLKKVVESGEYRKISIKWFGDELGNKIATTTETNLKK